MKNRKILIIAIAIIAVVVSVIGYWCGVNINAERAENISEEKQRLYSETFGEADLIGLIVIQVNEGFVECTNEQSLELLVAYSEIVKASIDDYTISEKGIKRFNNAVTDIFGSDASHYLIDESKKNRDPLAWYDGLVHGALEYELFQSDKIPDEVLDNYLEISKNLYSNLSHKKSTALIYYLYNLLEQYESDYDNTDNDAFITL